MASFQYKAMSEAGAIVRGTLEAPSEAAAIRQLRALGHYPLSAVAADSGARSFLAGLLPGKRRPSSRGLALATHELAELLGAGLELDRALSVLIGLRDLDNLKEPLTAIRGYVRDGASLADAMARESVFPRFYVGLVRAGEMGGALEVALKRLAAYLARTQAIRESILSALIYPTILALTAIVSIVIILGFVLPEFKPLFAQAGASLPLPSRIVMGIGDGVRDYGWIVVILGLIGAAWFRRALRDPAFKRRVDAAVLRIPVFGSLFTTIEIERFDRILGTLLANGVELPVAIAMAKEVLRNTALADAVADAGSSLREGESFARTLARSPVFAQVTLDLIQVGEETGRLPDMLLRQADLDEQWVKHRIDRLLALLVPCLTIALGLVIAALIASMLIAILSVNDLALQ